MQWHPYPINGPLSCTAWVSQYQKGKTNLDFTEARDSEWQLGHMQVCTSRQIDNHATTRPLSFLHARCPCCCPTNSVKALKALIYTVMLLIMIFSVAVVAVAKAEEEATEGEEEEKVNRVWAIVRQWNRELRRWNNDGGLFACSASVLCLITLRFGCFWPWPLGSMSFLLGFILWTKKEWYSLIDSYIWWHPGIFEDSFPWVFFWSCLYEWQSVVVSDMPLLSPNQQCKSNEQKHKALIIVSGLAS